jgi:hypothetical protein
MDCYIILDDYGGATVRVIDYTHSLGVIIDFNIEEETVKKLFDAINKNIDFKISNYNFKLSPSSKTITFGSDIKIDGVDYDDCITSFLDDYRKMKSVAK